MRKVYSWNGYGYLLNEIKIDDESIQDALECDDMETVIKYMIDTEQCYYIDIKDISKEYMEDLENDDRYVYIDNTDSSVHDSLFYVLIENMRVIEG